MSLPDRNGIFKAQIVDSAVSESQNGVAQFVARFSLYEEYDPESGMYENCEAEDLKIDGYFSLEYKDSKEPLEWQIEALMNAFGFEALSLEMLESNLPDVIVTIAMEEWDGKVNPKVKRIHAIDTPPDAMGGALPASKLKDVSARMDSKLKALYGAPKKAATPKTEPPKATPPKKAVLPKKATPPKKAATTSTDEKCYAEFVEKFDAIIGDKGHNQDEVWFDLVKQYTGKDDPDSCTPEEWGNVFVNITVYLEELSKIPF